MAPGAVRVDLKEVLSIVNGLVVHQVLVRAAEVGGQHLDVEVVVPGQHVLVEEPADEAAGEQPEAGVPRRTEVEPCSGYQPTLTGESGPCCEQLRHHRPPLPGTQRQAAPAGVEVCTRPGLAEELR
eukprot:EG_transcript_28693